MNFNILNSLSFLTIHGSQCYGMATPSSDLDIKGFCLPPPEVRNHLFNRFYQIENNSDIKDKYKSLINPLNPKLESVVYSLEKFIRLATEVNPNIIEVLFVSPEHILECDKVGETLLNNRFLFLSRKAKYTFTGYAAAQLSKIQRHRQWLLKGDLVKPIREDFGLKSESLKQFEDVFRYIGKQVETWNLADYGLDESSRSDLHEKMWEIVYFLTKNKINWSNFPQQYKEASINKIQENLDLKEEICDLIKRELAYRCAKNDYESWLNWKNNRNPARAVIELKYGYDCKHASQLVRLHRVGYEILTTGNVIVKRPDAEELLHIKNGGWSYDKIIEYSESMEKKLDEAYQNSPLPHSVDKIKINDIYQKLIS